MLKSLKKSRVNCSEFSDLNTLFASNLKFLLENRGVSIDDASSKTGIPSSTLDKICQAKSRVSATMLLDICNHFGVSLDAMIRRDLLNEHSNRALSQILSTTPQHPNHQTTPPSEDPSEKRFYEWLETKGCKTLTTPISNVQKFLKQETDRIEVSVTEEFDQEATLTATFTICRKLSSSELSIQNVSASIEHFPSHKAHQAFYPPECSILSLREIFNLMCGRSVYKVFNAPWSQPRPVWLKINFNKAISEDQYELTKYGSTYGFHLESVLRFYQIVECETTEGVNNLVRALNEGNKILVAFRLAKGIVPKYIEANPISRVLRITPFNQQTINN